MTDAVVLARGARFPELDLVDPRGLVRSIAGLAEGRPAVVFFMRSHSCPVCAMHVRELERMAARGALAGAAAVVVTPGGAEEAATVTKITTLPVLASGTQHALVGLGKFLMLQHSGTFVLDAEGRVTSARTSALPTASFSRREVELALA
jgi:peroxiredoxin